MLRVVLAFDQSRRRGANAHEGVREADFAAVDDAAADALDQREQIMVGRVEDEGRRRVLDAP